MEDILLLNSVGQAAAKAGKWCTHQFFTASPTVDGVGATLPSVWFGGSGDRGGGSVAGIKSCADLPPWRTRCFSSGDRLE